ncbi:MAG: LysM peptidoglycan-binding domain-containing protein [Chloroflexota bacterium]
MILAGFRRDRPAWQRRLARLLVTLRSWSAIPPRVLGHVVVVVMCLSVAYVGHRSPIGRAIDSRPDQQGWAPAPALVQSGPTDLDLLGSVTGTTNLAQGIGPKRLPEPAIGPEPVRTTTVDSPDRVAPSAGVRSLANGDPAGPSGRPDLSGRSWIRPLIVDAADVSPASASIAAPAQTIPSAPAAAPSSQGVKVLAAAAPSPTPDSPAPTTAAQPDASKTLAPVVYYVVDGDTLSSIAQQFGVSVSSIAAASGLQGSEDSLTVHQKLVIPPVPGVVHVVQNGETLQGIAARYSADFDQIALANGLKDPFTIQVGQTLIIPDGKIPSALPAPTVAAAPPAPRPPSPTPPAAHARYTVSQGDSLSSIASAFGVDLRTIVNANGLSVPYVLHPGQEIVIPGVTHPVFRPATAEVRTSTAAKAAATYTVQVGDSLSRIAVTFGVSPSVIVGANDLANPNALRAGEQLVIPGAKRPPAQVAATATPVPATATPVPPTATTVPPTAVAPAPVPLLPAAPSPSPHHSAGAGWQIVAGASKFLGAAYVWGGTTPKGFDCSGLVWYVYRVAGIPVPRDMWGQLQSGTRVARSDLQPGDIVFFVDTYQAGLSHDGIYIGGGRFINAENPNAGVAVASLANPYWNSRYYGAARPW